MAIFDYTFTVNAPVAAVLAFHHDTSVLKMLTPPPLLVQLHRFEPLGEGSLAEFTMWLGPVPVRWQVVHSRVGRHGFTDTQRVGPLHHWQHTHRFTPIDAAATRIEEHVEYEHHPGWRGWLTRLLFNSLMLRPLFAYRRWVTRRHVG